MSQQKVRLQPFYNNSSFIHDILGLSLETLFRKIILEFF